MECTIHQFYPLIFTAGGRRCQKKKNRNRLKSEMGEQHQHQAILLLYHIHTVSGSTMGQYLKHVWVHAAEFSRDHFVFSLIRSGPHSRETECSFSIIFEVKSFHNDNVSVLHTISHKSTFTGKATAATFTALLAFPCTV